MKRFYVYISFYLLCHAGMGQQRKAPVTLKQADVEFQLQTIKENYTLVNVPAKYSTAFYAAIDYYPELKNVRLRIVERRIDMLMEARPAFLSCIFRKPAKRRYKVFINTAPTGKAPTPDQFTFNAQVGIFGHELAHISDYLNMRCGKLMKTARKYHRAEFRRAFEQGTDKITLQHGLGWQLYDYANQWKNNLSGYDTYISCKKSFYLSPEEILGLMLTMGYE